MDERTPVAQAAVDRAADPAANHAPAAAPTADGQEVAAVDAAQHTQELLAEHVPLTLLVDLLTPAGPSSDELLATEGLPEQEWWSPDDRPGA